MTDAASKTHRENEHLRKRNSKYPLTLHATGQYCKKIRGKIYYFGKDKRDALRLYHEQASPLHVLWVLSMFLLGTVLAGAGWAQDASLVGWWKFDDGQGTIATDSSGKAGDGTFQGDPAWVAGQYGGALEFDGDDWLDHGDPPALQFGEAITIACWINPGSVSGNHALAGRHGSYTFKTYGNNLRFTTPGVRDHTSTGANLLQGMWQHVAVTWVPSQPDGAVFYRDGAEVSRVASTTMPTGSGPFRIGNNDFSEYFLGSIDDVRVYNRMLTEPEIKAVMENKPYPFPVGPKPKDGAMVESRKFNLEWWPGVLAVSHNVYLGEDANAVANATTADTSLFLGSATGATLAVGAAGSLYPDGLVPGKTYYWRVDAVNPANPESPWKGPVWSFYLRPAVAWNPSPADGMEYVDSNGDLSWQKGMGVLFHTVYIGGSFDEVNAMVGGLNVTPNETFPLDPLELGKTYYWRVDETGMSGTTMETVKGDVWSFTVMPKIDIVDPSLQAWWTLDEGLGTRVLDWSGHGYHGTVVNGAQWIDGCDGGALSFDGVNDYVNLGMPPALYMPKNYSYCLWFRVAQNIHGNSGVQYLLCIGSRSDLVFGVEDSVGVNGGLALHYYDATTGAPFTSLGVGKTDWLTNQWHFIVATKDAAVGHKVYLDGDLVNSDTNTKDDRFATNRIISLAAMAWTNNKFFRGVIDEVRIYNRALTDQEIQGLMRGDPLGAWSPSPAPDAVVDLRDAGSLLWLAGDGAASHDVYFGNDRDAVATGTRDSAAFKGNRVATSFSLAGLVDLTGDDYYWRIDEVEAGGTVHAGQLWKFTVPPYLMVDDFEGYTNNSPYRVFQIWIDGLTFSADTFFPNGGAGNGTTAIVGNDPETPPIMETVIVHAGQSMPVDYNNTLSPYYAEAQRTWTTPQDWSAGGVDTLQLFVRGNGPRFMEKTPGQYTISSTSGDIWGTADHMRLVYKRLTGDATIVARIDSMTNPWPWAKAGVMIREKLDPGSPYAMMMMAADGRPAFQNRTGGNIAAVSAHGNPDELIFPQWVKLVRKGDEFTAYHSVDGQTWVQQTNIGGGTSPNPQSIYMVGEVYIGLAVTSNNLTTPCVAQFSNVTTTGSVTGQWQVADVGGNNPANGLDSLYVVVEDSNGRAHVSPHPNSEAVFLAEYTPWNIPLSEFSNAGVNLVSIKTMYIGVGQRGRTTAKPDSAGRMYFDDINVIKAASQ